MFRLEQTCVLDRDRDERGELPQQRLVLRGERPFGLAEEVQRADDLALPPHRDGELREHVTKRPDVTRFLADVVDEDRPALLHRRTDHALTEAETDRPCNLLGIANRVRDAELLPFVLEEVDRKRREAGQARDELRNLGEQLIEVEDGRYLTSELEKGR